MSLPYEFTAKEMISQGRTTKENIEAIKTWLSESGTKFVPKFLCDEMIVLFLLSCKNNIGITITTIIAHYKIKAEAPEIFDNRNVNGHDVKLVMDTWIVSSFPYRTANNSAIHYFQLVDGAYDKMDNLAFIKTSLMLVDITQEKYPPDGLITIVDMKAVGLKCLTKINLDATKKFLFFLQDGLTMELEAIHVINSNSVITRIFTILKRMIKTELFDKIHFHSHNTSIEKLYTIATKEGLPVEFGGNLPSLKELHRCTIKQYKQRQEYWDLEERIRKDCLY